MEIERDGVRETVAVPIVACTPPALARMRAWPNPTYGAMTLSIDIPSRTRGSLRIYDSSGRLVRRLFSGVIDAVKSGKEE